MGSMTISKRVEAPQQVVFELGADLERAAEHLDAIERIELLTDGPIGVGTRWKETRIMFGKESTEEMEITSFQPPDHYTARSESCGCLFEFTLRFRPDGEATNVDVELSWRAQTLFAKLMMPLSALMMGTMKKCVEEDLACLKRNAEARVAAETV